MLCCLLNLPNNLSRTVLRRTMTIAILFTQRVLLIFPLLPFFLYLCIQFRFIDTSWLYLLFKLLLSIYKLNLVVQLISLITSSSSYKLFCLSLKGSVDESIDCSEIMFKCRLLCLALGGNVCFCTISKLNTYVLSSQLTLMALISKWDSLLMWLTFHSF